MEIEQMVYHDSKCHGYIYQTTHNDANIEFGRAIGKYMETIK